MRPVTLNTMENKLIVDFLNTDVNNDGTYELPQFGTIRPNGDFKTSFTLEQMKFDKDWNWLMEVVDKILNISLELDSMEPYYNITDSVPNIKQTHEAVIEFINYYNTIK